MINIASSHCIEGRPDGGSRRCALPAAWKKLPPCKGSKEDEDYPVPYLDCEVAFFGLLLLQ